MDVFIAGISHTQLGRHADRSVKDLTREAVEGALRDAGLALEDIGAAWFANVRQGQMEGQNSIRGQCALTAMGLGGIPIFNVENACASSSSALYQAYAAVKAGLHDIVLVAGTEKMYYPEKRQAMMEAFFGGTDVHEMQSTWEGLQHIGAGIGPQQAAGGDWRQQSFFMDVYASLARMHMKMYGTTQEHFAHAAAKNHTHSALNPLAQYQTPMSVEDVLQTPLIAWPLTRAMCAPISDGAAAAVVCGEKALARIGRTRAVRIRGMGVSSTVRRAPEALESHCVALAAERAYGAAGISARDIDVAEVHDASSFAEVLQIENLGLCARGEGGPYTASGATTLGGECPVNVSGGLVSKGHPIAATGIIQLHELATQLRGEAGRRQVQGARIAVAENGGGFLRIEDAAAVVTVLDRA
ncbi:thiolase family protein [Alicycliphilus denitrificans]|uniref:propanoyl-CoA C-acyltransferase n=1 Tax=Alicycliphilus denitrificans TaxID=179636 RepID=A0A3R7LH61_9BURK|nr:thiolase family protein [Alicycliphilus denitrificans]RKJ99203.1 thiolase family protein [Alicycliphilus denitrificans]